MRPVDIPDDLDGLMVLGLWLESSDRLRVRITRSTRARQQQPETSYASTKTEVLQAVESWLDGFVTPP
jgi:hypothetical protein